MGKKLQTSKDHTLGRGHQISIDRTQKSLPNFVWVQLMYALGAFIFP